MPNCSQGRLGNRTSSASSSIATSRRSTATWSDGSGATAPTSSRARYSASPSSSARAFALPWLYGLATNLALKRWRGDARHSRALGRLEAESRTGEPGDLDGADDRLAASASRARILAALAQLAAADRDVVVLVAWEELTYEEVATALDIPLGTVRSRLNRARRVLREHLPDFGNEQVTVDGQERGGVRHAS